jgi:poly-gamma-glutamate capsule biosynthesis protein CapA/YwtB (metallophosphatase superfamily)
VAELALLIGIGATVTMSLNASAAPLEPRGARVVVRAPTELEIAATGDVTLGRAGLHPAGGPEELLGQVAGDLRAQVSLGNLETTLVDTDAGANLLTKCGVASSGCHVFGAPESFARGLREVGFNVLNLANNHSNDYGEAGRARTLAALKRVGLRSTGSPGQVTLLDVRGVRVAVVGFAPYAWASNLLDLGEARRLVRRAAHRAQVVLVTMHIGAEGTDRMRVPNGAETYLGEARGDSRAFGHAVVDAGADLVVGHGPHVLRGIEWYRGRLIAHSLGNFSGHQTLSLAGDLDQGAILRVTLEENGEFVRGRVVPIRLVGLGTPTKDPHGRSLTLIRQLSFQDFGRAGARLDDQGRIAG